jgi:hypothetical protein
MTEETVPDTAPMEPGEPEVTAQQQLLTPPPRRRPVLGLSLWVFGVAMWSFVVMGQLATSYGPDKRDFLVSEGVASLFVFLASVGAWGVGLRLSLAETPATSPGLGALRGITSAFLAFLLWGAVTLFAAVAGSSSRDSADGKITVILTVLAGVSAYAGWRLAGLRTRAPTPRHRTVARVIGIVAALVTIVALAEVIASD